MNISPVTSYKQNNNEPVFQAVNMKYLERAKNDIQYYKNIGSNTLVCLRYDVIFKKLSLQDGIDTIKAIRLLVTKDKQAWMNEILGEFKYLAKKERIEERREAKKPKSCQ